MVFAVYLLSLLVLCIRMALGIPTIEQYGRKFFTSNGDEFIIKALHYHVYPGAIYPMTDTERCLQDLPLIKQMGVNVVSIFVDANSLPADECMTKFRDNGIYILVYMGGLRTSADYINYANGKLYQDFTISLDSVAKYDNLFAINIQQPDNYKGLGNAPNETYVRGIKSVFRDLRAFRDARGYRQIPLGFEDYFRVPVTAVGVAPVLANQWVLKSAPWLLSGPANENADWFSLMTYNPIGYCDATTDWISSGFSAAADFAKTLNVPSMLRMGGCQPNTTSDSVIWGEEKDVYNHLDSWVGNDVGYWQTSSTASRLFEYVTSTSAPSASAPTLTLRGQALALASKWATISPSSIRRTDYKYSGNPPASPSPDSYWPSVTNSNLATVNGLNLATISRVSLASTSGSTKATGTGTAGSGGSSSTADSGSSNSGLSTGAKAGIGAGIGLVVLIAIGILLWLFVFRRRSRGKATKSDDSELMKPISESTGYGKSELPATTVTDMGIGKSYKQEMSSDEKARAELSSGYGRQELYTPYHDRLVEAPSSQLPAYSRASELPGKPVAVPELSETTKPANTSVSDATSVSRFRESIDEPSSAISKTATVISTPSAPVVNDNLIDLDELAEDADIAVQELGVVQRKKKTLTAQAKAAGVSPDQLPGRKGDEWKDALAQEEKIHARLQEIERMRRS